MVSYIEYGKVIVQGKGHQGLGAEFAISNGVREGSIKKVTFGQRLEDTEGVNSFLV